MIQELPLTYEHQTVTIPAIPDPKHVWVDGDRIVVYTGDDIPMLPAGSDA